MRQTTLCVPLEVKPESFMRLSALIDELNTREDDAANGNLPNFHRFKLLVPTLHFMSMSVFPSESYDPLFIIEANFDGPPGVFWGQIEPIVGDLVRKMIRCCKRPLDGTGDLYDAVTAPDSRVTVARYLEARTQQPSVFHHGNRGLTRDCILEDHKLFLALRDEIDKPGVNPASPYRAAVRQQVHGLLRRAMLPDFPWLDEDAPNRIPVLERIGDFARLVRFVLLLLLGLSLPGLLLAPLLPAKLYLILVAICSLVAIGVVVANRKAVAGTEVIDRVKFIKTLRLLSTVIVATLAVAVAVYVVLATLVLSPLIVGIHAFSVFAHFAGAGAIVPLQYVVTETAFVVMLGSAGIFATLPVLMLALRYSEIRDSSQAAPPVNESMLREMIRREDWITQNHMGSIVLIKPGIMRSIIIRTGHYGLGLVLRVAATTGYLGSMRTVHFAHWAFLNNGSRLLFLSNFDHSWGSYLDDFIEKAHNGLTLAWGCGVGFPPTRMLINDGASHGRQFKNWALASRAVSRFWYSAYRDLTVDQIERNHRIANGLRQKQLNEKEAHAWLTDL